MKKSLGRAGLVLALAVTFQGIAWAEVVEGRISKAGSQSVDLVVYDPQGRPYPNALRVEVGPSTRLQGFGSTSQLRANDPVGAEIRQLENRAWYADSITLYQEVGVKPATKNLSPTLRDVLGNSVVRGALAGAATGAIASSASGGKAGKGALVGAGVGAAAGLLGDLFGGGGQQRQSANTDYSYEER